MSRLLRLVQYHAILNLSLAGAAEKMYYGGKDGEKQKQVNQTARQVKQDKSSGPQDKQ